MWWRETATSGKGRAPASEPPLSIPGDGRPRGRRGPRDSSTGCGGCRVAVGTQRPALTPGGGTGPSPRQGRHCGAVPRNRLQGPRTKRPHWGRRASERRSGREITFGGPSGCFLWARSLFRGDPPLAKGVCWSPTPRPPPPPQLRAPSTFIPLSSRLRWAGQGTRLPSARLQHKAGPGEGNGHSGSTCVEAARPRGHPQDRRAPLRWQHNFSPEVGFLQLSSVLGPTSQDLPLPARPRSPPTANGKPEGPASAPSAPRPRTAPGPLLLGKCARLPAPARTPLRPNLPPPSGSGARTPRVWFKLGSAGGVLWPRGHCILRVHRRGSRPPRSPG